MTTDTRTHTDCDACTHPPTVHYVRCAVEGCTCEHASFPASPLHAAAPDLLAALEALRATSVELVSALAVAAGATGHDVHASFGTAVVNANAAIAKARGV